MPVITYEAGQLKTETKKELVEQLTATASAITGAPKQFFTVVIREQPLENIGIGGETVLDMKARLEQEGNQ
jgi:4-oxalocrotonate tautomerase